MADLTGMMLAAAGNSGSPPPELISYSTFDTSLSVNTFTITKPTSVSLDNLLVCAISKIDGGGIPTAPSGWTRVVPASSANTFSHFYYKIATGSEPANYTWNFLDTDPLSALMMNWSNSGYNSTTNQIGFKNTPTAGNPVVTLGPLTAPADESVLIFSIANEDANKTFSTPSGFTAIPAIGTAHKSSLYVFYKTGVASGSTGTVTSSNSGASNGGEVMGQMILLEPV